MGIFRIARSLSICIGLIVVIGGCTPMDETDQGDLPPNNGNSLGFGPPEAILATRAVQLNNLVVEVTIGGTTVPITRMSDDTWSGPFQLPGSGSHALVILWSEQLGSRVLPLARASLSVDRSSPRVISLSLADYQTDMFDSDGDGLSNLVERQMSTNPFPGNGFDENSPLVARISTQFAAGALSETWRCIDSDGGLHNYVFYQSIDGLLTRAGTVFADRVPISNASQDSRGGELFGWSVNGPSDLLLSSQHAGTQEDLSLISFADGNHDRFSAYSSIRGNLSCARATAALSLDHQAMF